MKLEGSQKVTLLVALITTIGSIIVVLIQTSKNNKAPEAVTVAANPNQNEDEQIATKLSDALVYGRYDEVNDDFSDPMKSYLPVHSLQGLMEKLSDSLGTFVERRSVTFSKSKEGKDQVIVANDYTGRDLLVQVVFDEHKKVIGLFIHPAYNEF